MFALHTANRTELLLKQLATVMDYYPHGPFDPIHFLIQGRGMERWLKMRLAELQGGFALGVFDFPNRFFAALATKLGLRLSDAAFERHRLTWLIDELLASPRFRSDPALKHYLKGPGPELRRFQLARQLAQLFDQYQLQRRDWLAAWQRGGVASGIANREVERWQAALWHALYRRLGGHRGELWEALLNRLSQGQLEISLPKVVYVFGVSFLPRLHVELLAALSRHTDVHWFLLTPVEGYWADLPSKRHRALSLLGKEEPEVEWEEAHHPLLVALGRRGAQFQRLLLECTEPALESSLFPRYNPPHNFLQHLQNDLAAGVMTAPPAEIEVGIELHRCHTPLREIEVARDRILDCLARDPTLRLEEIAVMAPDISAYQPYLEAVFSDLPHRIADRTLGRRNPLLEILIEGLELLDSRFEWEAVLEFLGREPVRERFGLSLVQLPQLERWVRQAAIRWGLSGEQRSVLGLPPMEHNAWQLGVDRMLLGWMAGEVEEWHGLVPFAEAEGQAGMPLFKLAEFLGLLQDFWRRFQDPLAPAQWQEFLLAFTQAFFAETPETLAARRALEEILTTLPQEQDYKGKIVLPVIIDWLRAQVEEEVSDEFLSGGITCCTALPMRAVPFRLTVMVGLNDGEFPRREAPLAFDLMAAHPRLGDRDLRLDQRHQFLEVMLSTRDRLILICQGLTPEKNEERPPAQVVSELIDVLDQYGIERRRWIFNHPSHPFHPGYFQSGPLPACRDPARFPVAVALMEGGKAEPFWPEGFSLDEPWPETLSWVDLLQFATDAQGWFCRTRLKMAQLRLEELPEAREPFAVDGWMGFSMRARLIKALEQGENPLRLLRLAQRAGEWPQGEAGRQAFEIARAQAQALLDAALACGAGQKMPSVHAEVTVQVGTRHAVSLRGLLDHRREHGTLLIQPAKLNGKHLFCTWLWHLFSQTQRLTPTWLVALGEEGVTTLRFDPEPDWQARLGAWLIHFLEHWIRPSPWVAEWGFLWWRLHRTETSTDFGERWVKECLERRLPESFTLLFGEAERDFLLRSLPVYQGLLDGLDPVVLDEPRSRRAPSFAA
ncbi:MAG: exodeoxyribonuclease V subunit gamma [Methylohalobius sp.]|nr:exodeoxyribonuclease V subunit gamma [Methylohalobius sp.]